MTRLPAHHIHRPRVTEKCDGFTVVVVEAAGGYGKSVLGAELVDRWRAVGVVLELEPGGVPATLLSARLTEALRAAGYTDAASVSEGKHDPVSAIDAVAAALSEERCVFVIDDAHNALPDAGQLIDHLAARLGGGHRLVVLGRHLPEGAERLRRAEYLQLSAADLALDTEEVVRICRSGFGLDVGSDAAQALQAATGGWTAATVLAAARAARTGEDITRLAVGTGTEQASNALAAILDEPMTKLGRHRWPALATVARLPLIDAQAVEAVSGEPALFQEALHAGIPFTPERAGWWTLPGPVRDLLSTLAPLDPAAVRAAAGVYVQRGETAGALELLIRSGRDDDAAALIARTAPEVEETLDTVELRARFDQLSREAVDAHPGALVLVARRLGHTGRYDVCCQLLDRARQIAHRTGDAVLERAAAAELVKVRLLAEMAYEEAAAQARSLLDEARPDELLTRARIHEFLGYALCHVVDANGCRDPAILAEAEDNLSQAFRRYSAMGMGAAASFVLVDWAVHIDFPAGRTRSALDRIEQALRLTVSRPRAVGFVTTWRILFAAELGDDALCLASADEAFRMAERIDSTFVRAQAHWRLAVLFSYRGDRERTLDHLRQAEQHNRGWWALGSAEFLADAADLADRVGYSTLALEYLARAQHDPKDAAHRVRLAEAVLLARHGDPALAEERLCRLDTPGLELREAWRVTLLRAYAAFRRGDDALAGALAARAFEQAARLGQPEAPLVRERDVSEQLLDLAARTEHPAALALHTGTRPTSISVLGRFALSVDGRPSHTSGGQELRLLKYLAVSGRRAHTEQVIEAIWPEADAEAGRNRLRTVLHRLRIGAGDLVSRAGDVLVLDARLKIDLEDFLAEAQRAEAAAATDPSLGAALARGAMARYRGDVLPDDRYEDWAESPRRHAKAVMLELLDLCASDAAGRGDLDSLRRIVVESIELDPYKPDGWYVDAASALLRDERRGEALSIVHKAKEALARIGLDLPPAIAELERTITA